MEVSHEAMFLLTTSYQAYKRIENPGLYFKFDRDTVPCDELVTIVFLGFYIEASLTNIIERMGRLNELVNCFYPKKKPKIFNIGLRRKISWFYTKYVENEEPDRDKLNDPNKKLDEKLEARFPGFTQINEFRNDIAHGELSEAIRRTLTDYRDPNIVDDLRTKSKNIVDTLLEIANKSACSLITKNYSYEDVLNKYGSYTKNTI